MKRSRSCGRLLSLAVVLGACGGGDDDGGSSLTFDDGECSPDERVGQFRIDLADGFTGIQGRVQDSVTPSEVPDQVADSGACRLRGSPVLFCDPACPVDQVCGPGGTCVAQPEAQSVGRVVIEGMRVPVEMEPSATNLYTNPGTLPHPGFDPGAAIRLEAEGGAYQPFALGGTGFAAIEAAGDPIAVDSGAAAAVTWSAGSDEAGIHLLLDINPHGTTASWIECEVSDSGQATIPGPLIEELFEAGVSGFPRLILARRTVTSSEIDHGCVELRVGSEMEIPVEVPGLISCTEDEDCPDGETCQGDLTCG
jgi:hypothetical protein